GFAVVDHLAVRRGGPSGPPSGPSSPRDDESRLLVVAAATALLVTALYAGFASATMAGAFEPDLLTEGLLTGLAWSLVDHLWIGCAAFLALAAIARLARRRPSLHYLAVSVTLAAA